jgi:RND family efflux transporter MFP subunit
MFDSWSAESSALEKRGWLDLNTVEDSASFFQYWLDEQCSQIVDVEQGVLLIGPPDTGPFSLAGIWPPKSALSPALAQTTEQSLKEQRPVILKPGVSVTVAYPLLIEGHIHGIVALQCADRTESKCQWIQRQLHWGALGIEAKIRATQAELEQATQERLIATLDLVAAVLIAPSFDESVQALATDLAIRLDCDRVSIGLVRKQFAKVVALSHSSEFGDRMNLLQAIGSAMDEALDQKSIILFPPAIDQVLVTRDHASLCQKYAGGSILTVPFSVGETTLGAVTFERREGYDFNSEAIEVCQSVVVLSSRILETKRLNDRSLISRIGDSVKSEISKLIGLSHFGRKVILLLIVATTLTFSFVTAPFNISAIAAVEGDLRRVLIVPFDGYIASAMHRAGDVVKKGDVLASLDDRDLKLESFRLSSQADQYKKQYQEALAMRDRSGADITMSQIKQAEAEIKLLADRLSRTQITAPFDGLVVSGDLTQSLGSAVKLGQMLFEISPLEIYRVMLEVNEEEISYIKRGQKGKLMLTSLPGDAFELEVNQITPITLAREGRSYFRVEASLNKTSAKFRPGMEGVARLNVGERNLFWIWTHKFSNWIRLKLWSLA